MGTENYEIVAADVELGACALLLTLRGQSEQAQRVVVPLRPDRSDLVRRVLGTVWLTRLPGRAVRAKVGDGQVQDIGNIVADEWLQGDRPQDGAAALEMDPRNGP